MREGKPGGVFSSLHAIMTTQKIPTQARYASGINALLGAWLAVSPWFYGYVTGEDVVVWPSVVAGVAIGVMGMTRFLWPSEGPALSWSNLFLGGWVAISPWSREFADDPERFWNSLVVGSVIAILAVWSICATAIFRAQQSAHGPGS
jgi:hypothetical protein